MIDFDKHIKSILDDVNSSKKSEITKQKLESLSQLNSELNVAAAEIKKVSTELMKKLNTQVDVLSTEIKAISDTASEGIITLDYTGKIINLNKSVEIIFGFEYDEIINKDFCTLLPICQKLVKKGETFSHIMEIVSLNIFNDLKNQSINLNNYFQYPISNRIVNAKSNDGRELFLEVNVNLINPNEIDYTKFQYICILKDITELINEKMMNENLSNFHSSLIEAIPIPVYWKDKNFNFLGCNSEFEKLTGLNRDEIIGKNIKEIYNDLFTIDGVDISNLEELNTYFSNKVQLKINTNLKIPNDAILAHFKQPPFKHNFVNRITGEEKSIIIYRTILVTKDGKFNGLVCSMIETNEIESI